MLCPDLSMGQTPADTSIPGFYFCRFSAHSGGGMLRLELGVKGTITYASGVLKTRGRFCRYRSMAQGQYSSVGQDLEAMMVLTGAVGLLCPQELRAPQIMISIQTGAGEATLDTPTGQSTGQCFHVHSFGG
jgi:hypothetical protein